MRRDTLVAYNEIEPYAVEYMRWLMNGGLIAPGYIFTDPLEDLTPNDLRSFKQIHWCAGVGVWSYALRSAGWPDDRPIWTASLPCQPFSAAGKGDGFADQRHLWPFFVHHVITLRPQRIVGEQVESPDGMLWFDAVCLDLEGAEYASRAVPICSAGFGSPDIRNRNYWCADRLDGLADANDQRRDRAGIGGAAGRHEPADGFPPSGLADDTGGRRRQERADVGGRGPGDGTPGRAAGFEQRGLSGGLADACGDRRAQHPERYGQQARGGDLQSGNDVAGRGDHGGLADAHHTQRGPGAAGGDEPDGQDAGRPQSAGDVEGRSGAGGVAHAEPAGQRARGGQPQPGRRQETPGDAGAPSGPGGLADAGLSEPPGRNGTASNDDRRRVTGCEQGGEPAPCGAPGGGDGPGPVNGFWSDADWILCRDPGGPRWRPVEPGTFPLVDGAPARMGRLRAAGNAINAQVARAFIEELMADDQYA